jgi:hypothetical protein
MVKKLTSSSRKLNVFTVKMSVLLVYEAIFGGFENRYSSDFSTLFSHFELLGAHHSYRDDTQTILSII